MTIAPGNVYCDTTMRITATFKDGDDNLVDPTSVVLKTRSPCGTETTYTYTEDANLVRVSEGSYLCDFLVSEPGRWFYRWETVGSDAAKFPIEGNFIVQVSAFDAFQIGQDYI